MNKIGYLIICHSVNPFCFNFFGELKNRCGFCVAGFAAILAEFIQVKRVIFEFAPAENYTNDKSAFDVAIEVMADNQSGLVGSECKYTDIFSQTEYDKAEYRHIFNQSKEKVFATTYEELRAARFNQLFRNQLIAEALVQNGYYQFVYTGLFCHQNDESALQTAMEFQRMLRNGDKIFKAITYQDFIEKMQRLDSIWERRELSMFALGQIL